MGNSKSNQQNSETINVNHPYFGDIQVIEYENEKYMKIKMLTEGQKAIQEWEKLQQLVKGIDQEPLLLAVDHKYQKQGMCGTTGVLNILYENHPVILKDEIQNRRQTDQSFQENEVWYLLHVLISSAAEFHKRSSKVGDIRPDNIFINEQGQLKLANLCSWPREENNYFKSLNDKQETYLAPEQMNELQNDKTSPNTDPIKGQSFSIGLTLIDAICLEDSSKLYNFKNFTFDKNNFFHLLSQLQSERYSDFLKETVNQLLILDPKERKSPEQIYQKILPYEYNIKNLLPFSPIMSLPYPAGRSTVSNSQNNYPQSRYSYAKNNNQGTVNNYGFTQSVYQTKNNLPNPITSISNFPSHGFVSNRTTPPVPTQTYINKNIYDQVNPSQRQIITTNNHIKVEHIGTYAPVTFKSNQNYGLTRGTALNQGTQSKQKLWDEIDKQIQNSRRLFQ